jgi:hypothetical protein
MAELHVVSALRNKRAELAGIVRQLEPQLAQQRTNLAHLEATMQLFDLDIRPLEIRANRQRARSAWFRQGECFRLIYEQLRDAPVRCRRANSPSGSCAPRRYRPADDHRRELIQKTVLGSLNRAKETIARVETAGVVSWRLNEAAWARCQ